MRNLIITADDFGNSVPINEAVEEGYHAGILSAASLMVTGDACEDAVKRSINLTKLGIGLHITLLDGNPVLPRNLLPNLVSSDGRFFSDPIGFGIRLYYSKEMQEQAEMEIEAQFQKFRKLGINLDHVNSHKHFHLHPSIVKILGKILPEHGSPPVRVPYEPFVKRDDFDLLDSCKRVMKSFFLKFQCRTLNKELLRLGIFSNQNVFGLFDTGDMDEDKVINFINHLPFGTSEIYFHPATRNADGEAKLPKSYKVSKEREAIQSQKVKSALVLNKLVPITYNAAKSNYLKKSK